MSPDGRQAYATAFDGDAVSTLARNPTTGAIAPVTCVKDVRTAPSTSNCPVKVTGLNSARMIVFSPEGAHAYVASQTGDAVAAFSVYGVPTP